MSYRDVAIHVENLYSIKLSTATISAITDKIIDEVKQCSNELRKRGIFVSASGVRSIWLRHQLQSHKLRIKALEAKVAAAGTILT